MAIQEAGMRVRSIGDRLVSAIGLGCMPLSVEGRPEREQSLATIRAAVEHGVTLLDTADAYHQLAGEKGHNELLVAEALRGLGGDRQAVMVATKGGLVRPGDGTWVTSGSPEYLAQAARDSASHLGQC